MSSPQEELFRSFEEHIAAICARYPTPISLSVSGRSASHTRQQLKLAMECYRDSPGISSEVPRHVVENILALWVFSNTLNSIYIGPRKRRQDQRKFLISHESSAPDSPSLPPIDCTSFEVFSACCTLKNLDAITLPLTLTNVSSTFVSHAEEHFPNIVLQPTETPGSYILL